MKAKDFLPFYLVYLQVLIAIFTFISAISRDFLVNNWMIFTLIGGLLVFAPFLVLIFSYYQGAFAKWLRLLIFPVFRVQTIVTVGLLTLSLFTILFLVNLFRGFYQGEQIFLNVLLLNIFFVLFFALILSGRFQFRQPSALLLRPYGHPEVYLYQDGNLRHIPDPLTLRLLGYSFDDVVDISETEYKAYIRRPSMDSVTTARLIRVKNSEKVWMIFGENRKYIPDGYTLGFIQEVNKKPIEEVSEEELCAWEESVPLESILRLKNSV